MAWKQNDFNRVVQFKAFLKKTQRKIMNTFKSQHS